MMRPLSPAAPSPRGSSKILSTLVIFRRANIKRDVYNMGNNELVPRLPWSTDDDTLETVTSGQVARAESQDCMYISTNPTTSLDVRCILTVSVDEQNIFAADNVTMHYRIVTLLAKAALLFRALHYS